MNSFNICYQLICVIGLLEMIFCCSSILLHPACMRQTTFGFLTEFTGCEIFCCCELTSLAIYSLS